VTEITALGDVVGGVALLAACYLLGSLPFSVWIARAYDVDVRKVGSGNPGATNVLRSAGRGPGVFALLCDIGKGALAVALARWLTDSPAWWGWAALAAVCGHVFSIFLRFQGGKGVATAAGALCAVSPSALGLASLVFVAAVATTRYVSLGSILAALAFPIALWFLTARDLETGARAGLMVSSSLIALIVLARHRANLKRLLTGTENKLGGIRTA
jgi:acyl phosphate:glycerol-3-phosphate acyltransferase